ncbi:unnamed protein product [Gadus morhua 'NCC']
MSVLSWRPPQEVVCLCCRENQPHESLLLLLKDPAQGSRVLRLLLPTASNPGKEGAAGILAEPTLGMTSETDDMGANSWTHVLTR